MNFLDVVFVFQAYCSSIAGALSLRATFEGLGVGEGAATSLAATLTWLLKDGSGMIASIAFAYWRGLVLNDDQFRNLCFVSRPGEVKVVS